MIYFSPFHDVSPNWYSRLFPVSSLRAAYLWYLSENGRVTQAVFVPWFRELSRLFDLTPETYPVEILRATSCYLLFATPVNFLAWLRGWKISWLSLAIVGSLLLLFWIASPLSYFPAIWMDHPLLQYFLPLYILSLMALFQSPRFGFWHLVLYFFLSMSSEHYFVATPILLLAFAMVCAPISDWKLIIKNRVPYYAILSTLGAVVFSLSPGQHRRNGIFAIEFPPAYKSLFDWYEMYGTVGYNTLFPGVLTPRGYGILQALVCVTIAGVIWWSRRRNDDRRFRLAFLSASFMVTYLACLSTTLVSAYFPFYCVFIPNFFLMMGLSLILIAVFPPVKTGWVVPIIALAMTLRKIPDLQFDYKEVRAHSLVRRWVGEEIGLLTQPGVKTHFRLLGFPRSSYGMSLESEWALRGYLEWRRLPGVSAWVEPPVDPKPRENRVVIDYSNCPIKMEKRKISELSYFYQLP